MFIVYLAQWWYGSGWLEQWKKIQSRTTGIGRAYSGKTLLKTMFAPWKRIVAYKRANTTIQQKIQGAVDNLVSRFVGAGVRFFTLLAALVSLFFVAIFSIILAILWPLVPLLSIAVILKAFGAF